MPRKVEIELKLREAVRQAVEREINKAALKLAVMESVGDRPGRLTVTLGPVEKIPGDANESQGVSTLLVGVTDQERVARLLR